MRLPTAEEQASIAAREAAEDAQAWLAAEHYMAICISIVNGRKRKQQK